jgi:hypothetical protein
MIVHELLFKTRALPMARTRQPCVHYTMNGATIIKKVYNTEGQTLGKLLRPASSGDLFCWLWVIARPAMI